MSSFAYFISLLLESCKIQVKKAPLVSFVECVTCVAVGAARGGGDEPGRAHSSAGRAASGRASSASWRSKTSGGRGEERETLKGSGFAGGAGLWMGTTRAALLPRGGARATLLEDQDDDEGARRDGEGGGRRRWEGAAAAVAGDGALRRR